MQPESSIYNIYSVSEGEKRRAERGESTRRE